MEDGDDVEEWDDVEDGDDVVEGGGCGGVGGVWEDVEEGGIWRKRK